MDKIQHNCVEVNGLKLHVAEIGTGSSVVLFLHGFPEIWYSWRHQMTAVANAGFRAIAPDYRGYGLSDPPPEPENTTFSDLISDLRGILDALAISTVFLIAKDFGARPAFLFALLYPERVRGIITLGVPFTPQGSPTFFKTLPEGFYIKRWQEPGRAEADFGRLDAKTVVRNIYILFSKSELPIAGENQEIMDLVEPSTPLPPWFTEDDLASYGALYEKSGFRTALKVPYRSINEEIDIPNQKVEAPTLLIMGEKDYFFKFPGAEDYVRSGQVKYFVPNLEITYMPEGSHFIQEQMPDQLYLSLSMDQKQHKFIDIRGVKLHIAEIGTGILFVLILVSIHYYTIKDLFLLFCRPFSCIFTWVSRYIWYSWRHQMIAVANFGFRAITPDLRGYALSGKHPKLEKASFNDFVEDALAIL